MLKKKFIKVVIPPSVDTNRFRPYDINDEDVLNATSPSYEHPSCKVVINHIDHQHYHHQRMQRSKHHPCVVVGFIARLAPGTLIMATNC